MMIEVKFFASLRERMGRPGERIDDSQATTVAEVWHAVAPGEGPGNLLAAVNMEYVDFDHPVRGGDEVAFFPPVTGG